MEAVSARRTVKKESVMLVFGPVPSRRLGKSLGINNIPPKECSYSCVYCQIGRTTHMRIKRCAFYQSGEIYRQTEQKMNDLRRNKEHIDYISFVPDGEPTLDIHLGRHIRLLKAFGVKIAVITNASLLWMEDVKLDLMNADWVSVKLDAADNDVWKRIDRPHGLLTIDKILKGIADFARGFQGTLVTETMLVGGVNDDNAQISEIADILKSIKPHKAYLLVPTRPPAEASVVKPAVKSLCDAYDTIRQRGIEVECITGDDGDEFYLTDDIENDLLSIASVHPLSEDTLEKLLRQKNLDVSFIDRIIERRLMDAYMFEGKKYYKRNIAERKFTKR